jgi:hypothetical protein
MAEVIDFFSAWLDRKVAAVEKGQRELQRQVLEALERIDHLPEASVDVNGTILGNWLHHARALASRN